MKLIARALEGLTRRLFGNPQEPYTFADIIDPGMSLCPKCIFIEDEHGEIVEVIDCRTLNHHHLKETP